MVDTTLDGELPFKSKSGNPIRRRNGYFFKDGKVCQVSDLFDKVDDWLKVKAYIIILEGKQDMYTSIAKADHDSEITMLIKLLKKERFKTWTASNPIIPRKEKQK